MEAYFVYVARILHTFASFLNASFLKELFDSWSQDFAIDGLIIYVNNMRRWKEIGRHPSTGNPQPINLKSLRMLRSPLFNPSIARCLNPDI